MCNLNFWRWVSGLQILFKVQSINIKKILEILTLNEKCYHPKTTGPIFFSYLDFMDPTKTGVKLFQCLTSKKSIDSLLYCTEYRVLKNPIF